MLKFLNYLRYRSLGLILLTSYLYYSTRDFGYILILALFIAHTYNIYRREDGGVNHLVIIQKLNRFENKQDKNQEEIIDLLRSLK